MDDETREYIDGQVAILNAQFHQAMTIAVDVQGRVTDLEHEMFPQADANAEDPPAE